MKHYLFVCFLFLALSCKENRMIHPGRLPHSVGDYNHLTLIIKDSLWNGEVGDSIRKYLAAPIDGLSQDEPLFILDQYSPKVFVDKNRFARNLVVFSNADSCSFSLQRSKFATPQNLFTVHAPTAQEMLEEFQMRVDSIISTIKSSEINEKQHEINREPKMNVNLLRDVFGIKMVIPSDYNYVLEKDNFIWVKKDVASGNSNLLFYEVPLARIENSNSKIANILAVKDSIGKAYVHGTTAFSFMKSDDGFSPFIKKITLDHLDVKELRGTWDMKNSFMNGPYLCYVFKDDYYNRYLFVEGFTYNPSNSKRDFLFELEAIIKTISFHE